MLPRLNAQCRMHGNQPLLIRYICLSVRGLGAPAGAQPGECNGSIIFEDGRESECLSRRRSFMYVACAAALPKTFQRVGGGGLEESVFETVFRFVFKLNMISTVTV